MSRHLKNIVIDGLKQKCATFVQLPSPRMAGCHRRLSGVRYFYTVNAIESIRGAMDEPKLGQARRKRIIVRPSRFRLGLHELYTYHFPKHWSAACIANRELIKEAQRQAHALEHDHSIEALEWRVRFFNHYFSVFKSGAKPEPGMKAYSRFYQYTYVAIYRQLKAAQQQAQQEKPVEEISFEPIVPEFTIRPKRRKEKNLLDLAFSPHKELYFPPPNKEICK